MPHIPHDATYIQTSFTIEISVYDVLWPHNLNPCSCSHGDRRTMSQTSTSRTFLPANRARPDSTVEPDRDLPPGRHSVLEWACCRWRWPLLLLLLLLAPLDPDRVSPKLRAPCTEKWVSRCAQSQSNGPQTCNNVATSMLQMANVRSCCSALLVVPKLHRFFAPS